MELSHLRVAHSRDIFVSVPMPARLRSTDPTGNSLSAIRGCFNFGEFELGAYSTLFFPPPMIFNITSAVIDFKYAASTAAEAIDLIASTCFT